MPLLLYLLLLLLLLLLFYLWFGVRVRVSNDITKIVQNNLSEKMYTKTATEIQLTLEILNSPVVYLVSVLNL